jgi:hypothetical protein
LKQNGKREIVIEEVNVLYLQSTSFPLDVSTINKPYSDVQVTVSLASASLLKAKLFNNLVKLSNSIWMS